MKHFTLFTALLPAPQRRRLTVKGKILGRLGYCRRYKGLTQQHKRMARIVNNTVPTTRQSPPRKRLRGLRAHK